ncbi:hypothetical protein ACFJIW_17465 [Tahibacter sp. UC22_41]|uniref:hypothetical protein n=1 Tax=Tahibacter sp. UC22_41 TaxID=3350178 RepID=UPI0036DB5549
MAHDLYCWRCDMVIPMLEEHEWALVEPLLRNAVSELQHYALQHGLSPAEAKDRALGRSARDKYRELTGFEETNVNALYHHRASLYGPPCTACGKPLRTPRASFCAACGTVRT